MGTYITLTDVQDRMTARVVQDITDDNADGTPDPSVVAREIADAESKVEGYLRGNYDLAALRAMGVNCPNEVKRLCLDVVEAKLMRRHPEYVRAKWEKILELAEQDLMNLRKGATRLDIPGAPEPAANQGGVARTGEPDQEDLAPPVFNWPNSFGVF